MMCPNPMLVKNKYGYVQRVKCGKCVVCRLNRAHDYSLRIMNELVYHKDACFLTLTYDEEHLPSDKSLHKREFQLFMKRFRRDFGKLIRFFACGEYGSKEFRPHYHVILFGVSPCSDIFHVTGQTKKGRWCDLKSWDKGHCFVGDVTYDSACYVAKYCAKQLVENGNKIPLNNDFYKERGLEPPFLLMSTRPGIGAKYVRDRMNKLMERQFVVGKNGVHYSLPRYYRQKLGLKGSELLFHEQTVDLKDRAFKVGKSVFQLDKEILENAKNIVESFLSRKGVKENEI